jgi:hypothetical protein
MWTLAEIVLDAGIFDLKLGRSIVEILDRS